MVFPKDWENYMDSRDKLLLEVCDERFDGNLDDLMERLHDRFYSSPMYLALQRRLVEDISRVDAIRIYKDLDEFIQTRIVDAGADSREN